MFKLFNNYGRSWKWSDVRKEHLKIQPTCQACGRSDNLEVHHIEPFHLRPEKELDPNNLITLCSKPCHLTFGHLMDYKSWNMDVVNDCSNYLSKLKTRPYHERYNQKPSGCDFINNIISKLFSLWNN
jgi:5-methylcytosine-specific restriction endonuclease McrA